MRRVGWALFAAIIVADAALTACGGDEGSGEGECATGACGGDLDGTWEITSLCGKPKASTMTNIAACDSVAAEAIAGAMVDPNGATITFTDGAYTVSGTAHMKLHDVYTNDCLTAQQGNPASDATCAEVESNFSSAGFPATCHFSAETCVCDTTQDVGVGVSGTYRKDGAKLVFDADKTGNPFCVMGDTARTSTPPGIPFSGSITILRK